MAEKVQTGWTEIPKTDDPKEFLLSVMNNAGIDGATRLDAARALMPYYHERLADDDEDEEESD